MILVSLFARIRGLVKLGQGYVLLSTSSADSHRLDNATSEFSALSSAVKKMNFAVGYRTVGAPHGSQSNVVKVIRLLRREG